MSRISERVAKICFLLLFFAIFLFLNILVGLYLVNFYSLLSILSFFIIQLINMLIAYRTSEFVLSFFLSPSYPPQCQNLHQFPPVALLYVTYNDVNADNVHFLKNQSYPDTTLFILDDSDDPLCGDIVDKCNCRVVRRSQRIGYKAGAINNWIRLYGNEYKYFLILDSDSRISQNFVMDLVKHAEHPANSHIAVFQSKCRTWNTMNRFPRIIGSLQPMWFYSFERLANIYENPLIMGHNNLLNTAIVTKIGGLDEEFICEDLALSIKLLEHGYTCRYVDIISYDASPETAANYGKRMVRWAKGTIEVSRHGTRNISFLGNLHLFMTLFSYLIYLVYIPGMIIVTWGYKSNIQDLLSIFTVMTSGIDIPNQIFIIFILIFLYFTLFYLVRLPLAVLLKIPIRTYITGLFLVAAIDFMILIPLNKAMIETALGKKAVFIVTDKKKYSVSLIRIFRDLGPGLILWGILVIGSFYNPLSFIFNFFWIIPFIVSPVTLYLTQRQ